MNPYIEKLQKAYDGLKNGMKFPKFIDEGNSFISIPPITKGVYGNDYVMSFKEDSTSLFIKFLERNDLLLQRKFVLHCLEKVLIDSKDMEKFGYTQFGFTKFKRNNILVERVYQGIKIGMKNNGFFPFVISKKRMKSIVVEFEKEHLDNFMDLSDGLRDELVKA